MKIDFILNSVPEIVDVPPYLRFNEVLRNELKMKSIRNGCSEGKCGICLVLMDRKPVYSCLLPVIKVRGREILTAEGALKMKEWEYMDTGLKNARVHLCPYCASARALSIVSLLLNYPLPDNDTINDILFSVNCSCTGLSGIREAIINALRIREEHHGV